MFVFDYPCSFYISYIFKINIWTYSFQEVLVKETVNGFQHNRDFSLSRYSF